MKKILFLLLSTVAMYGQVPADATPLENIQITNNQTSTTATKVNVQENDGTINTISKADLVNVVEVNDVPSLPLIGEAGKIYVVKNLNKIYRWNGTFYQELTTDISGKEDKANKSVDFSTINNILFPTVQAVKTYADDLVVGMLNDRGTWDASGNAFPITGGSGVGGTIRKGDMWYVSVEGTLGLKSVNIGDAFRALVNNPAQISIDWSILEGNVGYVPENVANKQNSLAVDGTGVKYPTVDATNAGLALKQNTLTNPVTGTGTTNTFPMFIGSSILGNSVLSQVGLTEIKANATISSSKVSVGDPSGATGSAIDGIRFSFNPSPSNLFGFGLTGLISGKYFNWYATGRVTGGGHVFYNGNSETLRIDTNGNILVNTSVNNGVDKLQVAGSGNFTGTVTAETPTLNGHLTTKLYVDTANNLKANLASPALTGTPTAPTAALGTNTTQIATTAFVKENTEATQYWTKTGNDIQANNTGKVVFGSDPWDTFYGKDSKSIIGTWLNGSFNYASIGIRQGETSFDGIAMYLNSEQAYIYGGTARNMNVGTLKTDGVINASINNVVKTITSNSRFESLVPIKLKDYTVATLPTGTQGDTAYVTDALAPTYMATVVGGGAVVTPVFYNGTAWVSH